MHRTAIRTAVVCASAAALILTLQQVWPAAQDQGDRPAFRGGVELIQIDVSVLDGKRQPVKGLSAADFTVLENGVARPIRAFTAIDIPAITARADAPVWARDVAPDVATNQIGDGPGRLVVILMDRSIPYQGPTFTARKIATSVVESLGPNDLAALVSTSGGAPQNFTADRTRLISSINQRDWSTESQMFPWGLEESLGDGRCLCGLCVLETVTQIAHALRDVHGRSKALFFIGQGIIVQARPRSPTEDPGCDRLVRDARITMLEAVALSGLTIHSIDPKGLFSVGPQTRASTPGGAPAPEGVAAALRRQAQQQETNDTLAKQGTLHVLPDLTGGRTVVNRNMPEEIVPAIFRESESYYLLAFEAGLESTSSRPRSIEVKVDRKGVRVSTQRQYVPPTEDQVAASASSSPTASAARSDAINGLLPDAVPRLTMALAAFANPQDPRAFVSVNLDAGAFVRPAEASTPLEVSVVAVDQTGRPVGSAQQTSTLQHPQARGAEAAVTVHTHLALPPGDYEIRAAVADPARNATASVFSQIVIPAFATERLSLSSVAIERVGVTPPSAAEPFPPVVPTTARAFGSSEPIQAFVQIYQGTDRTDPLVPVTLRTRLVDARNHVVSEATHSLGPDAFRDRRMDVRAPIPTPQLAPGEYLLSVVATAGERSTTRLLRFTVR